jgi:RNA polymerase-binding transcription factor DksA
MAKKPTAKKAKVAKASTPKKGVVLKKNTAKAKKISKPLLKKTKSAPASSKTKAVKAKPVAKKTLKKVIRPKKLVSKPLAKKSIKNPILKKAVKKVSLRQPTKSVSQKNGPKLAVKAIVNQKAAAKNSKPAAKSIVANKPKPIVAQKSNNNNINVVNVNKKFSQELKPKHNSYVKPETSKEVISKLKVSTTPIKKLTDMANQEKTRYSDTELAEFKELILQKLEEKRKDLDMLKGTIDRTDDHGTDDTAHTFKPMEDGSDVMTKEEVAQLATRQKKIIQHLENALFRIENKTYGICRVTGKLIPKERLKSVPHATTTVEAKMSEAPQD